MMKQPKSVVPPPLPFQRLAQCQAGANQFGRMRPWGAWRRLLGRSSQAHVLLPGGGHEGKRHEDEASTAADGAETREEPGLSGLPVLPPNFHEGHDYLSEPEKVTVPGGEAFCHSSVITDECPGPQATPEACSLDTLKQEAEVSFEEGS